MILQTPTSALSESIAFYEALHFTRISDEPLAFSDGKVIVEVNAERSARAALKLYAGDWSDEVAKVKDRTYIQEIDSGYLFCDPAGVWIYLIEGEQPLQARKDADAIPGNYMGISLEYMDFNGGVALWQNLGFEITLGAAEQGWVAMMRGEDGVSLMATGACPHLFFNPSMTYFNSGKNPEVIERVRTAGIDITEEITVFNDAGEVDNIIIRDPGGFGFFLFND